MAKVALSSGGLATSGDYERYILKDGVRYGHILDPRTGWPARGLASATVLAGECLVAGSLATIAVLKGGAGIPWLESMGVPHCWMDEEEQQGGTLV